MFDRMKRIEVVAAVIVKDGKVLATQRGYGDFKGMWEFPGGKIEAGESPETALAREIHEELDAAIQVDKFLGTVEYDYPSFHLTMHCFACSLTESHVILLEHESACWTDAEGLSSIDWLPADLLILDEIRSYLE